ncbi:MAG: PilZ domain-containing protein [Thermodesulfobacteriota bacterium]|nr:PilZ domain-containing protein [Thermodesulfobacteriota bacterium]
MTDVDQDSEAPSPKAQLKALVREISDYIENASEEQQQSLLGVLGDERLLHFLESPQSVNRRKYPRKICSIVAGCSTQGRAFKGMVKNISLGGMFIICIETEKAFSVGQQITVSLPSLSKGQETMELQGEIVWTVPDGIGVGVKITTGAKDLAAIMRHL